MVEQNIRINQDGKREEKYETERGDVAALCHMASAKKVMRRTTRIPGRCDEEHFAVRPRQRDLRSPSHSTLAKIIQAHSIG